MPHQHARIRARHSAHGPAVWVFLSVLGLFFTAIIVLAWFLYELIMMGLDVAGRLLTAGGL